MLPWCLLLSSVLNLDLDRLLRDGDAELFSEAAARRDYKLVFAVGGHRRKVAVDDGLIAHRHDRGSDDDALGVLEPDALVLRVGIDRELLAGDEDIALLAADDKPIGLMDRIENGENDRLRALSDVDGFDVGESVLELPLGVDEGRELVLLAIPRGVCAVERARHRDAGAERLELEAVAFGELAGDFGLGEIPDVSDALLVFARTLGERLDEVLGADGSVVLDSGRVARGVVAFLERAQAGSIAKFSHIVFLSFVLVVALWW